MLKLVGFLAQFSKRAFVTASLASLLSGASNILLIALINSALNNRSFVTAKSILLYVGICLVVLTTNMGSQVILVRLGQRTVFELRNQLSRRILKVPLRQLEIVGAHRVLAALTEDIASLTNFASHIPTLCMSLAIIVGCLCYVLYLSWTILLLILGLIVLGLITYRIPMNKGNEFIEKARNQHDIIMKHFNAMTKGAKELKLRLSWRKGFIQDVEKIADSVRRSIVIGLSFYAGGSSWGESVYFLLIGAVVFGMPLFTEQGIGVSVLTGTALVLVYMRSSMEAVIALLPIVERARISLNKIETLGVSLEGHAEVEDLPAPCYIAPAVNRLELRGVMYTYQSEKEGEGGRDFVLGPIDLTLYSGEIMFLAGGNGSGKTTFAKVITGLYTPDTGEILLNDKSIINDRDFYRQHFSAVFSDFFLFEKLYSEQNTDSASKASKYLVELRLDHKVQIKDDAFSTVDLSQGQRKRLALLSILLEDRPVCLFDEWAADQDPLFRDIFYKQILPELKAKGKMVIVISHDERYYNIADRVVYLEDGKILYRPSFTGRDLPGGNWWGSGAIFRG
jgi:putative ATP-binding cassette transporter